MDQAAVKLRSADARKNLEAADLFLNEATPADWKLSGSSSVAAGIAASDAVCGHVLGYCALGQAHEEASGLLQRATPAGSRMPADLKRLLSEKSLFQYGIERVTHKRAVDLRTYAARMVAQMEEILKR